MRSLYQVTPTDISMLLQHDLNALDFDLSYDLYNNFNATLARFKRNVYIMWCGIYNDFNATLARFKLISNNVYMIMDIISMLLQHDLNGAKYVARRLTTMYFNATLARFKQKEMQPTSLQMYLHFNATLARFKRNMPLHLVKKLISMLLQHDLNPSGWNWNDWKQKISMLLQHDLNMSIFNSLQISSRISMLLQHDLNANQ